MIDSNNPHGPPPSVEGTPEELSNWDTRPLDELIRHIVTRYHQSLRDALSELIEAAKKVERVHANEPGCPQGLAEHLAHFSAEVLQHLVKEEQVLFPTIRSGVAGAGLQMPIRVMMQEHEDHAASLRRARELTSDLVPPAAAGPSWRALYADLEKLESEMVEHMNLENDVLFPRALNAG